MKAYRWKKAGLSLATILAISGQLVGGAFASEDRLEVDSIRLIEGNYIEILWNQPVENSTIQDNYRITINGAQVELSACYYYDRLGDNMTSLRVRSDLSYEENTDISLTIVNDGIQDIQTADGEMAETATYTVKYDPFYTQTVISDLGFTVKGSKNVDATALEIAADTIDFMLSQRPDIAETMIGQGADIAVTASKENAYYLPEYRDMTDMEIEPARGLGGNIQRPTTSIAQDELLQNEDSLYPAENVFVHEFGHAIKALGIAFHEDMIRAYEDVYIHAKQTGLWANASYLYSNQEEFFACLSNIWFETVEDREDSTAFVNTKEELYCYDPMAYDFFEQIYPNQRLPENCWDYEGKFSNTVVIEEPPEIQEPEPPVDPDSQPPEDYDLDIHYFKILSYLGSNVVQSDGNTVSTWWDYSNSWLEYNFDALSWRVTKTPDGYYRFTMKTPGPAGVDLALMPENSGTAPGTIITVGAVDENNDSQLWKLVRTEGYLCQIVNKASGLVLGTKGSVLPADGTMLVLNEYEDDPAYGNQWKVIRLKDQPGDENLTDDHYAIRPEKKEEEAPAEEKPSTGSGTSRPTYPIVVETIENGSVEVSTNRANGGQTITIYVSTAEGYEIDRILVKDSQENQVEVKEVQDGTFTFKMPDSKVTVFVLLTDRSIPNNMDLPFDDVVADAWFYTAVRYTYNNKLMEGITTSTFAPLMTTNRAMIVTILWRLEGQPETDATLSFTDVESGVWYTDAVNWAASKGIVKGYSDTEFAPNDTVTREQLVTILYRYAETKGYDVTAEGDLTTFADGANTSSWAAEAMEWAVGSGLLSGKDGGKLDPTGTATRAEVATILMRFVENKK